ncbi:MAG: PhoPQ-activated protein PqaA family protein [Pseudomonadales bacterium]
MEHVSILIRRTLVVLLTTFSTVVYADDTIDLTRPLFDYVHSDQHFQPTYNKRFHTNHKGVDISLYTVHSQVWQERDLYNQFYIAIPESVDPSQIKHLLLIITGGSFRPSYNEPPTEAELERFVEKTKRYTPLIRRLDTAAVVVRNIPFQRMKLCAGGHERGQKEDALIACSLQKYLETGDETWPLLFPMTKTVKVNMDIAQEIFQKRWGAQVESFTAVGASKRGWTTHMISIVDDRIAASIPIVINMLNMPAYIEHSLKVWGTHSPQIEDYAERGILAQFKEEQGTQLLAMIDPYTYREHLDKPKLMIFGTNDPYWPVDSTRHYAAGLPGETRLLFLPNQGHGATLRGMRLLIAASNAMHQSTEQGKKLASLDWLYSDQGDELKISLATDRAAKRIEYWSATSEDRDFRDEKWVKRVLCGPRTALPWTWSRRACSEITEAEVPIPADTCRAQFVQAFFQHDEFRRYPTSTDISVTGPERCVTTQPRAIMATPGYEHTLPEGLSSSGG